MFNFKSISNFSQSKFVDSKPIIIKKKVEERLVKLPDGSVVSAGFNSVDSKTVDVSEFINHPRIPKFNSKKKNSYLFAHFIRSHVSVKMHRLIENCSDYLGFVTNVDKDLKLVRASSCGNRFCPFCAYRKARRDSFVLDILMQYLTDKHKYEYIFVTLTSPNVSSHDLSAEITKFNAAFKKLSERSLFSFQQGYVRKLEVTYNSDTDTYHPHFHLIFAVKEQYFKDDTYVCQKLWLYNWRDCMDDQTITQVDVRRIYKSNKFSDTFEIAKYAAKDTDYLVSKKVFDVFYAALKNRQYITFNAAFKFALAFFKECIENKKLRLQQGLPAPLNPFDKYIKKSTKKFTHYTDYFYNRNGYKHMILRKLSPSEFKKYNSDSINPSELNDVIS